MTAFKYSHEIIALAINSGKNKLIKQKASTGKNNNTIAIAIIVPNYMMVFKIEFLDIYTLLF